MLKKINFLSLALITGAFLRLLFITREGLWHDEAVTGISAFKNLFDMVSYQFYIGHTPLYLLIVRPFTALLGNSELVLRLPSVIFGVLSIYAIYLLTSRLFEEKFIINTCVAMFTLSALQVLYSQEARPYTMILFFSVLSMYFFVKALEGDKRNDWMYYIFSTLAALYLSVATLPMLAVQLIYALVRKGIKSEFNWSFLLILLIYSPIIFFYVKMGNLYFLQWVEPLSLNTFHNLFYGYLLLPVPLANEAYTAIMKELSLLLLIVLAGGIIYALKKGDKEESSSIVLLWLWLIVPIYMEIFFSIFIHPIMGLKSYLIAFSPAIYLLLAHGIWNISPDRYKKAACIALVIMFSIPLFTYYFVPKHEDWRGPINYLKMHHEKGQPIFTDFNGRPVIEYYWKDKSTKISDVIHVYSERFGSGWIIMRDVDFVNSFISSGALRTRFKVSEPKKFKDLRLIKISR